MYDFCVEVLLLFERWVKERRIFQMMAQSIARIAIRILLRAKNVQFVATCALIGFMGDLLSSQNSKSTSSLIPGCKWFFTSCLPCITVKPCDENRNKYCQEVKNLESKISTIETPLEIEKL